VIVIKKLTATVAVIVASMAFAVAPSLGSPLPLASALQTNGNGNGRNDGNQGGYGVGLEFTVNSPITVDELGVYIANNALTTDTVDLMTVTGGILATATFSLGNAALPAPGPGQPNDYTFASITPVTLSAGTSYYLMAYGTSSVWELNSTLGGNSETFTTSSLVTFLRSEYVAGNTPGVLPNTPYPGDVFSAGNLDFNAASATPLPSTWTMLIAGFIGLGFFTYRGTKKNAAAIAAA
jgi:hypothetical protein